MGSLYGRWLLCLLWGWLSSFFLYGQANGQAKREDYFYSVACKWDSGGSEKRITAI